MSANSSYDVSEILVRKASLTAPVDASAVLGLLDAYARDPMGLGTTLPADIAARVIDGLRATPNALVFLAEERSDNRATATAVGLAVCFTAYSTFRAGPLINVHDLVVAEPRRGRGIGKALLRAVEDEARRLGCVRVTLEVLSHNERAQKVYAAIGFARCMEFWTKELTQNGSASTARLPDRG